MPHSSQRGRSAHRAEHKLLPGQGATTSREAKLLTQADPFARETMDLFGASAWRSSASYRLNRVSEARHAQAVDMANSDR